MEDIRKLRHLINYTFNDISLLKEALTHRSYASENNLKYDNQRLEYLGDAVLEIVFSNYLFNRYKNSPEGLLTKMRSALVRQDSLAELAGDLKLYDYVRMGRGEIESGGPRRDSTLCDLFEALVGAIYLDSDINTVTQLLIPLFEEKYPDPLALLENQNPKGSLQEYTQRKWGMAPEYKLVDIHGPDHDPKFVVTVTVNGEKLGSGEAGKRKTAEGLAAQNAMNNLTKEKGKKKEKNLKKGVLT